MARPAVGEKYPSRYLGPWIDLPMDADEDRARLAFKRLLSWFFLAPALDATEVCVPRYADLPLEARERLHVAVGHQLQAGRRPHGR